MEWKKCPKCGKSIPQYWRRHNECGWGVQTETKSLLEDMRRAILDTFEIGREIKEKYPNEYHRLDLTKISMTLFINRIRQIPKK